MHPGPPGLGTRQGPHGAATGETGCSGGDSGSRLRESHISVREKSLTESLGHTKVELKSGPVQAEAEQAAWRSKGVSGLGTEGL